MITSSLLQRLLASSAWPGTLLPAAYHRCLRSGRHVVTTVKYGHFFGSASFYLSTPTTHLPPSQLSHEIGTAAASHMRQCQFCKETHLLSPSREVSSTAGAVLSGQNGERMGRFSTPKGVSGRLVHTGPTLWAGHNKWSKVKYIKGPKDIEKSKAFTKIGIQLRVAIKEGGPNPETNTALAQVIALAKNKAMPRSTLDSMIKRVAASKQGDTQATFEVRGPGNSSMLVNVLTDNTKRTHKSLSHLVSKNGGVFGEHGTAMFAFQRKGVVRVPSQVEDGQETLNFDTAEELAIDVGAEEVSESVDEEGQNVFVFICDPSDLRSVREGLAQLSHSPLSSGLEYVPQTTVALSESDMEAAADLINALEDHEEVVRVFDNIVSRD
ncbi:translational activator of cytochrome c oxidase 1-like [Diadema setosum]|uniref:translational activator of cytochrome c oxidase 1-like n=1 Tax=Diadema setosum TaxID=31175 RepID=UPI003B3A263D